MFYIRLCYVLIKRYLLAVDMKKVKAHLPFFHLDQRERSFNYVLNAIAREKELKKWSRAKKVKRIDEFNPNWNALNEGFYIAE